MSDLSISFRRTEDNEYAFRVPTPPRIVVPPPAHNTDMIICLNVRQIMPPDGNNPDMAFLATINQGRVFIHNSGVDWAYERRRMAQEVTPYLFLGPHSAAKDYGFLTSQGITMLLGVIHERTPVNAALRIANELGIQFQSIGLANTNDLISTFPKTTAVINRHLADVQARLQHTPHPSYSHGKVFVFCESGNERSAAVIAAWMMEMLELDFVKAIQLCQCQRFCVNFDDNLKYVMRSYGDILQARRQVASSNPPGRRQQILPPPNSMEFPTGNVAGAKRGLDLEDSDMGDEDDDMERFLGRDNAPFRDAK
ncbi:phosphatases II [Saccharata proteae CBS 121410]|uniref:Phosphatases II n=1 Tax=Saccharata proteae CBS 121410 TaxID=1314787 RepID=A0A6A5YCC1_9PEZI|nr:phosphatases II [Saccharata proteae CBS 121410]